MSFIVVIDSRDGFRENAREKNWDACQPEFRIRKQAADWGTGSLRIDGEVLAVNLTRRRLSNETMVIVSNERDRIKYQQRDITLMEFSEGHFPRDINSSL